MSDEQMTSRVWTRSGYDPSAAAEALRVNSQLDFDLYEEVEQQQRVRTTVRNDRRHCSDLKEFDSQISRAKAANHNFLLRGRL